MKQDGSLNPFVKKDLKKSKKLPVTKMSLYCDDFYKAILYSSEKKPDISIEKYLETFDITNVIAPYIVKEEEIYFENRFNQNHNILLQRMGDIINKIEINGYNITKIQLRLFKTIIWEYVCDFEGVSQIFIEPFISGIITLCTCRYNIYLTICSDILYSVKSYHVYFPNKTRIQLCKTNISIKYNSPTSLKNTHDQNSGTYQLQYFNSEVKHTFIELSDEDERAIAHNKYIDCVLKQQANTFTAFSRRRYAIAAVHEHMFCECCRKN